MKHAGRYLKEAAGCLLFALVLYLFYRSVYTFILLVPFWFFLRRFLKKEEERRYREKLGLQFKDALLSIAAALRAGYSVENAVRESYREVKMMYGEEAPICTELMKMMRQMSLGIPVGQLFNDLAADSGIEEIETFAAVFGIAKKTGGDMVAVIRKTAEDIAAKIETKNEISVMITAKRFEQNIMNCVPLAIIVYVSLTSGGLLEPLYGNAAGILIMTVCLGLYAFAFYLSRKIMDIRI